MINSLKFILLLGFSFFGLQALSQVEVINHFADQIRTEQKRIDLIDGKQDNTISLKSGLQTEQATEVYIALSERILVRVVLSKQADNRKIAQLKRLTEILKGVEGANVHFYTRINAIFSLIQKVQESDEDDERLVTLLETNIWHALQLIAFYIDHPAAPEFFIRAAEVEPAELLKNYADIEPYPFNQKVLDACVKHAPVKVKSYMYSNNPVHKNIKTNTNPLTLKFYQMIRELHPATRSLILLHDVYDEKISIQQAHQIAKEDSTLFDYLIHMPKDGDFIGRHSMEESLKYLCLKQVRLINELHNEKDAIRFASLRKYNAYELYTIIVYSEEEIFTSTFLGMYDSLVSRMQEKSSYEFLHALNYLKFQSFIKMCAGYNVLGDFLSRMTHFEKRVMFKRLVQGLDQDIHNLENAVAIADTYGSINELENKMLLEESIIRYYHSVRYINPPAEKLFALLINILNIEESGVDFSKEYSEEVAELTRLPTERIFKDGKNIQQHFFFDDTDGHASYNSFVATFNTSNWVIIDKGSYVLIKSVKGKEVEIYTNKPDREYAGQKAISQHFASIKRWPDIVVHRGHSYFANTAIESLTPNAEIVFLGSCGGYNNISQVLNYSPDAQIISSKQIGTMLVNNKLCYDLNETIRQGKDIVWEKLWEDLEKSFQEGSTAETRFRDYIPPHKNLGALLIKTYRSIL